MSDNKLAAFKGLLAANPPFPPPSNDDLQKGAVASKPPIEPPKGPSNEPPKETPKK